MSGSTWPLIRYPSNEPEDWQPVLDDLVETLKTETADADGKLLGEGGLAAIAANLCPGNVFEVADCILEGAAGFRDGPVRDDMTLIIAEIK